LDKILSGTSWKDIPVIASGWHRKIKCVIIESITVVGFIYLKEE